MFHARLATHGVKNEENCHPFIVGGDSQTYLAHNGILDVQIDATDKRSDTRVFAEDVLPAMGGVTSLDDDNVWKIVSKWAMGSKIAIFTLNPKAKDNCYIINEDAGHWDNEGNWWSNTTYKVTNYWDTYKSSTSRIFAHNEVYDAIVANPDEYACVNCDSVPYEDANPYYCETCFTCYDCAGLYDNTCLCWSPEADSYRYDSRDKRGKAWYADSIFDSRY
jgi:glutamine amidotransferase